MWKVITITVCLGVITLTDAARILAVFPPPSESHHVVFRPYIKELVRKGHEVTLITSSPEYRKGQTPENFTEIDIRDAVLEPWKNIFSKISNGKSSDLYALYRFALDILKDICDIMFQQDEVRSLMSDESKQFDLLILEAVARPLLGLSHKYKAPVILISSFSEWYGGLETLGAMVHPLLYPTFSSKRLYNLTLFEKIIELHQHYKLYRDYFATEKVENEMLRKHFGQDMPPLKELKYNIDMFFMNVHKIWDNNRPVPPNIIHLGSMNTEKEEKDLPENLKSILDSSKNGVIYMSFGSNVNPALLPLEKIQIFTKVFSDLPYDILWKFDKDHMPGLSKNVKLFKWLPQSDLLKHPKVKLFITQGGLQSTDESIAAGVPMIGVPLIGDQWVNSEKYVHHKIGLQLEKDNLTEEIVKNAIYTIINDTSYRENVAKLRKLMTDEPLTSLERAVWWTEYVLRHRGAKHLRPPTAFISYSEYFELKIVFILLFILFIMVVALIYIYKAVSKYLKNCFLRKIKYKTV